MAVTKVILASQHTKQIRYCFYALKQIRLSQCVNSDLILNFALVARFKQNCLTGCFVERHPLADMKI